MVPLLLAFFLGSHPTPSPIAMRVVAPLHEHISMHWRTTNDSVIGNIGTLRTIVEASGGTLLFAMNGGMFDSDHAPVGWYVENGVELHPINRRQQGYGNFHLQPNGVFGVHADGHAFVRSTEDTYPEEIVAYATQSGPMLVVDRAINGLFTPGSNNLYVRNGVGIRANGEVVFGISLRPINFHDFANWFIEQGCTDALYLDGSVSKAYIPEAGVEQPDGDLGVLIAVTARTEGTH